MALTPEDVVKKEFSKPKGFGRSGYDEIQVDDFLDEIVVELRRLNAENDTLSDKLDDCRRGQGGAESDATMAGQPATRGAAAVPALTPVAGGQGSSDADKAEIERLKAELAKARETSSTSQQPVKSDTSGSDALNKQVDDLTSERDAAKEAAETARREAAAAQSELEAARKRVSELENELRSTKNQQQNDAAALAAPSDNGAKAAAGDAAGVLALAQRLHDQHVKDGENERDRLLSEAKAHHEKVVGEANSKSEELLSSAKKRHDELVTTGQKQHDDLVSKGQKQHDDLVSKGQKQHDDLVRTGTEKSTSLVSEAEERRKGILADLETRRTSLTGEIDRLKGFEMDYRSNLKGYLSEQLRKLDEKGTQSPADKRQ